MGERRGVGVRWEEERVLLRAEGKGEVRVVKEEERQGCGMGNVGEGTEKEVGKGGRWKGP